MNKLTKGALSMVLAGSITFSVAHTLLGDQSSIRLAEENASTISEDQKKVDKINHAEIAVIDQTPASKGKDHEINALEVAPNNSEMNESTIQQNSSIKSNPADTSAATTVTSPSVKAPITTATISAEPGTNTTSVSNSEKTKPSTTPTTTAQTEKNGSSTSSTEANRGQQVSQAAKEKAENHGELKENNGKNM